MKRFSLLITFAIFLVQFSFAQDLSDAFRLSNHQIQGTARSAGMGNAFGALGGDFSSISINPAGSAIYRNGEFVITPGYYNNETERTVGGQTFSDNEQSFVISNIGAIGTFKLTGSEAGIININYGIGYNRLANFNSSSFANYNQSGISYLDDIANYANIEQLSNGYLNQDINRVQYRDWPTKLAWDTYLIDPVDDTDGQYQNILYENEKVDQQKTYMQEGHLDEYLFNVGLNFNHKFYLGTTIGIHDLQYERNSAYEEFLEDNNSFRYDDEYYMEGYGFNFKIGAIYKPNQNVRLGLAFHSPTWYEITEESLLGMDSQLAESYSSYGINSYDYDFNSPMKVVLSGAVLFNKRGLISVDAEYVDYTNMRFRNGGNGTDNFNDLNSEMDQVFDNAFNFRVGTEYRLTKAFTVRAGYEFYANPYGSTLEEVTTLADDMSKISAGFGYSVNSFSLNVAYVNSVSDYDDANVQPNYYHIPTSYNNHNVLMTFGFRF